MAPFKSEKQKRFLAAKHPDVFKEWLDKYGAKIVPKKKDKKK